ncbi:MAG TPA: hypothetical protein VK434_18995, partial [Microvirga sp.]|nr:hypothetical protein [Microvirga sp.]
QGRADLVAAGAPGSPFSRWPCRPSWWRRAFIPATGRSSRPRICGNPPNLHKIGEREERYAS